MHIWREVNVKRRVGGWRNEVGAGVLPTVTFVSPRHGQCGGIYVIIIYRCTSVSKAPDPTTPARSRLILSVTNRRSHCVRVSVKCTELRQYTTLGTPESVSSE